MKAYKCKCHHFHILVLPDCFGYYCRLSLNSMCITCILFPYEYILIGLCNFKFFFVYVDALHRSQQFCSHVGMGFKTNYRLMKVKSIAEYSKGSILQYFRPSLRYHLSIMISVFSGCKESCVKEYHRLFS